MSASAVLLLADSRLPAGGHAHSGGLEPAASTGRVHDLGSLADFLGGRLATVGFVAAVFAAAACRHAIDGGSDWVALDREVDVRTPPPAVRAASRAQGRALLRAGRAAWPGPPLDGVPRDVHHPVAIGASTKAAGGDPRDAAQVAAYLSISGPASAAVRLLALDPLGVHGTLAALAPAVDEVALAASARSAEPWASLPAVSAPVLDVLAQLHQQSEVRLFES